MKRIFSAVLVSLMWCAATAALADNHAASPPDDGKLAQLAEILGKVAIVVVILESALSAVFNWRVYREVVNHRAWKTPVMLAFGLAIAAFFGFDLFSQVLVAAGATAEAAKGNWLTLLISAMILAGGSSGINTLFKSLGLRSDLPDTPVKPQLDQTEAWVSVLVNGAVAGKRYQVAIHSPQSTTGPRLAGTVEVRGIGERLAQAFRNESRRFPNYGGQSVKADTPYVIELVVPGEKTGDSPRRIAVFEGSFAPRSIIDFNVEIPPATQASVPA